MRRRAFLKALSASTALAWTEFGPASTLVASAIDSHIHLFDPRRIQGVPWPDKTDAILYRPALPERFEKMARPLAVAGAIAVECSPWPQDNDWLNEIVKGSPSIVGFIGNLSPESTEFAAELDRLDRSPLFLGIRYGNLWGRDLNAAADRAPFVEGLRVLASHGLILETANQDAALIAAAIKVSDRVPDLRIVLDHLPNASFPTDQAARAGVEAEIRELSQRPHVFVKFSEILHRVGESVPTDLNAYRETLDRIWDLFGEDRIIFGSDWPNSDTVASYQRVLAIARQYLRGRSKTAQQKFFRANSRRVYRWVPRTPEQAESRETVRGE